MSAHFARLDAAIARFRAAVPSLSYQDAARLQAERWKEYADAVRALGILPAVAETAGRNAAAQSTAPELKRRVIAELGGPMRPRNTRARTTEKHQAATARWRGPLT